MSKTMHIWRESTRRFEGIVEVAARIETGEGAPGELTFRVPAEHVGRVSDACDALLIGMIFPAMLAGSDLHIHGRVSARLLRGLEDFQSMWNRWLPDRYDVVDVRADEERDAPVATSDRACMAFSGGLDSSYSAWRHAQGQCGRRNRKIETGVMVHGFDIPLKDVGVFDRAAENSRQMLASLGMELIPMSCNFRQNFDNWEDAHGAAIAACLHLVAADCAEGLIASSHVYEGMRYPWGSNPLSDPLLSSASFAVVHDGGEVSRREKAKSIAGWETGMARLRVCWEGREKDKNCGQCSRCVFTALCFAVEDVAPPAALGVRDLEAGIGRLFEKRLGSVALRRVEELYDHARSTGVQAPWLQPLGRLLSEAREERPPRSLLRKLLRVPRRRGPN